MASKDEAMSNAGFAMFVGLLFISGAVGTMYTTAIGCLVFGGGIFFMGLLQVMINYLDKGK